MQRTPAIIEHLQDYVKHSDEMKFKQSLMGLVRAEGNHFCWYKKVHIFTYILKKTQ